MFPIVRVYSDSNGDSQFEDILIPLEDAGKIGHLSDGFRVSTIIFREVEPSYDYNFHQAPQRQYLILLEGAVEIETSYCADCAMEKSKKGLLGLQKRFEKMKKVN